MSLHPLPNPTPRLARRGFAILRTLAAAAALAAFSGPAAAADPPAAEKAAVSDVVLARSALAALDAEPELKGVNLVVSVVDRVAVIGGPVATAKQSRRAEEVVRGVRGVADVRNTCFVALGPDPLLRSVVERMGTTLPPRPTMYELPGVLSNHLTPAAPEPAAPNPGANQIAAAGPSKTVVVRKPAGEPGILGAPVGPAGVGSPALPSPAVNTAPAVLTGTAGGVLLAADAVRKTEPRFAALTLEWRGAILVIGGSAPQASDAWDLAKKLEAVPGVNRIAVAAVAQK